eukprot:4971879-Pyramimonas_sp.AAC.1
MKCGIHREALPPETSSQFTHKGGSRSRPPLHLHRRGPKPMTLTSLRMIQSDTKDMNCGFRKDGAPV